MASTEWDTLDVDLTSDRWGGEANLRFRIHTMVQQSDDLGGDVIDIREENNRTVAMTLADVTGHGREAAPFAMRLRNVLADLDHQAYNQGTWLARVNERLCNEFDDEHFCAAIHVRMRWSSRHNRLLVSLTNAGMPAPLVYRAATCTVEPLTFGAPPLGLSATSEWLPRPTACTLAPGDTLLLFSDGLSEAQRTNTDLFSSARIARIVQGLGPAGGRALLTGLNAAVTRFTGNRGRQDDLALATVRVPMVHELTATSTAA